MEAAYRKGRWMVVLLLGAAAGWMAFEVATGGVTHSGFNRGTPQETIVVAPGRAMIAFYAFLVVLTLLPALWVAGVRSNRQGRPAVTAAMLAACAAFAALVAGFAYEALQTRITLTHGGVAYRAGRDHAAVGWREMTSLKVHWGRGAQSMEIGASRHILRIDLSPYSNPDKMLLVTHLPRIAGLNARRKTEDGWEWVRRHAIPIDTP